MRNDLKLISMRDVQAEEVRWLWYPYIPLGKLTIVQGDPGEGKTTFVLAVVAALTRGEALPESEQARAPMSVIYQTAEDGLADTIKPRLEASGADCARVLVIDESNRELTLCDDRLEQAVHWTGARLIVLDPIQAYLGDGVDMHWANEVRPVLQCVAAMAERTGCAVILIGHMNTVDLCMKSARTRAGFIREMERRGYQVRWEENRKAITYTTPKGKKSGMTGSTRTNTGRRLWSVNSESGKRCSVEELKERNLPHDRHPSAEEWNDLLAILGALYRLTAAQADGIEAQVPCHGGTADADGGAGEGSSGDPSTAGAERTGWEEERAQAFASAPGDPAPPQSRLALGRPDLAGAAGTLVQWGRRMEQSAEAVPPADPMTRHGERKALAKEREKKIALGHKPDDHEEQNITLSM